MGFLKVGYNYTFKIIERASSGVRIMTIRGKLDSVDDFYIWINGENFTKESVVSWE